MKIFLINFISFSLHITILANTSFGQIFQKKICKGELVQLELSNFAGEIKIQWEESQDLNNWTNITNATNAVHVFTALKSTYCRAKIQEDTCSAYFSDTISIVTDTLIPQAMAATEIGQEYFEANWNVVNGATGYLLDVAMDVGFTSFIEKDFDVGDITSYYVSTVLCNSSYYYRIRAYFDTNGDSLSCISNIIGLKTDTCVTPEECTIVSYL